MDFFKRLEEQLRKGQAKLSLYVKKLGPYMNRKIVSLVPVIAGIVLLGYVGSEYWGMYRSQRRLAAEWERQAAIASSNSSGQAANASGQANAAGEAAISPDQMLTRVVIPKIGLDAIVVEGASRKALSEGPGHMKETALPGETGNAVITGHRDTFFRHIYELAKGDQIQVWRNGRQFTYEVTGKKIVLPEDVSVIRQTPDAQLTLITCYPTYYIGPAPKRLVVFSKLVETEHREAARAGR